MFTHGQKTTVNFCLVHCQTYCTSSIYTAWVKLVVDIGLGASYLDSKNL